MKIRDVRWSIVVLAGTLTAAVPAVAQTASDVPGGTRGGIVGGAQAGTPGGVSDTKPGGSRGGVAGGIQAGTPGGVSDTKPGAGTAGSPGDIAARFLAEQDRVEAALAMAQNLQLKGVLSSADAAAMAVAKADMFRDMTTTLSGLSVSGMFDKLSTEMAGVRANLAFADASQDRADRERDAEMREREREIRLYDQGRESIDQGRLDRAVERFSEVVAMKGTRADAALYFKAYAQNRLGQRAEALATIAALGKDYPKSRYLTQAKSLESEVRRDSGQPVRPENESDEELKLMALNALQNTAPEQAIPMIQKILDSGASPKLKERALFVLAQSSSPQAREILKGIAKGNSTPELQSRAIAYLGTQGGRESRAVLAEVYGSTTDADTKRRILRSFMSAGEKDRVLAAAQSEQIPEVRLEAVRLLGAMGAHEELWQLYQKETSLDVKKQILSAMFAGGNVTRMIELAKTEQNPELRRTAVRNLANMGSRRTGDVLLEIYAADKDPAIRRLVIQGLANQENAAALVALARKEEDITLKKEMVQRLSTMRSPVATAYMLELLNGK